MSAFSSRAQIEEIGKSLSIFAVVTFTHTLTFFFLFPLIKGLAFTGGFWVAFAMAFLLDGLSALAALVLIASVLMILNKRYKAGQFQGLITTLTGFFISTTLLASLSGTGGLFVQSTEYAFVGAIILEGMSAGALMTLQDLKLLTVN
jgi:hypothetical protein